MGRLHNGYDVFLGDDLAYKSCLIQEDQHRHVVIVKERQNARWVEVLRLTDTGPLMRPSGGANALRWEGTDPDGDRVTLTANYTAKGGCVPCSRR